MYSPTPTVSQATTPSMTGATTPATSEHLSEYNDTPECMSMSTKQTSLTKGFHLDTFFDPVWMSSLHVFSFARDGAIVRPETYAPDSYSGYHADRTRRVESVDASHLQGFTRGDPKPWKNVAITEQDDAEFEAFKERTPVGALGEWRHQPPYGPVGSSMASSRGSYTASRPGHGW